MFPNSTVSFHRTGLALLYSHEALSPGLCISLVLSKQTMDYTKTNISQREWDCRKADSQHTTERFRWLLCWRSDLYFPIDKQAGFAKHNFQWRLGKDQSILITQSTQTTQLDSYGSTPSLSKEKSISSLLFMGKVILTLHFPGVGPQLDDRFISFTCNFLIYKKRDLE